jgi:hypothetical protein
VSATTTPNTHETVTIRRVVRREVTRMELQHGLLDDSLADRHQYRRYTSELPGAVPAR